MDLRECHPSCEAAESVLVSGQYDSVDDVLHDLDDIADAEARAVKSVFASGMQKRRDPTCAG
ncbi:hypothetical protein EJB06_10425 [Massilia atriviolacea]|uniref:Uncharacterized protein n=2 Tax=Massilia atriviolacea TaxID=2495579 RepID=A0A430HPW7_9BURK|nr:hypothetical protein EJB06_10425 [Massilia atriviolacea]